MNRISYYFLAGLLCILASGVLYGQNVRYKAAEGYMPDVVTIKREMPDKGRLCVEPPSGGLLSCKPIGEVRWWFAQAEKK